MQPIQLSSNYLPWGNIPGFAADKEEEFYGV